WTEAGHRLVVPALVAAQPVLVAVVAQREVAVGAGREPTACMAAEGGGIAAACGDDDGLPPALCYLAQGQLQVGMQGPVGAPAEVRHVNAQVGKRQREPLPVVDRGD